MSANLSMLSTPLDGVGDTDMPGLLPTAVAYVVGVAPVTGPVDTDEPAMRATAGRRGAEPAAIEPEVYCRKRGMAHGATGFASCSELGCKGCTRRENALPAPTFMGRQTT